MASDLEDVVRSNSIAKIFTIQSMKKNNIAVQSLLFDLDLTDDDAPVAQVAKILPVDINIVSGE